MKYIKDGLFYFLFFYVVIMTGLFVKQTFVVRNTMYKEITLEPNEKYETFIKESRAKLANYKSLATTQEEIKCLNEVNKAINMSYEKHHAPITNYKEAKAYYYKMANEELQWNNYSGISKVCNFKEIEKEKKQASLYTMRNVLLLEEYFWETNLLYEVNVNIPLSSTYIIRMIAYPSLEATKKRAELDLRSQLINNDINYIDNILKLVGEKYEV